MKKIIRVIMIAGFALMCSIHETKAQDIPGVGSVAGLGSRIIKAIDLKIQRLQNQQIWLQNAQKVMENAMSQLHLKEIGDWVTRQRDLYQNFYDELWQVKSVITYYHRIKEIADKQVSLVKAYQRGWDMFRQDSYFNEGELDYISKVYQGILGQTLQNVNQLAMVLNSFTTQMSDAARMKIIDATAVRVDQNYADLLAFNKENSILRLQRIRGLNEVNAAKKIYGL